MKSILAAALFLTSQVAEFDDYDPAEWATDSQILACSPDTLSASDTLILDLAPNHGRELAIRRASDGAWYFLVVGLPPEDTPQLMTTDDFAEATRVEIPAFFATRAWAAGAQLEPIINTSGVYEVYVSDNLESELGGHICSFKYTGMSPNNSVRSFPSTPSA